MFKVYELRAVKPPFKSSNLALLCVAISLFSFSLGFPQGSSDYLGKGSEEVFEQATKLYRQGEYAGALERYRYLLSAFPTDKHYTGSLIMASRCQIKLGNYQEAERGLNQLLEMFPQSSYRGAAYMLLGDIAFLRGKPLESALYYLRGYESSRSPKHRERARRSYLPLLERHLSLEELEGLTQRYRGELLGEVFFYKGKRELGKGQSRPAMRSLDRFLALCPDDPKRAEAVKMLEVARSTASAALVLGVLAPLSGPFADYGNSMVKGIKLALGEQSNPEAQQVELAIRDTKGEAVTAASAVREFAREQQVAAILGPLRSETAVGAAVSADCYRLPIVTPTASEAGIAALSDFVYQLSPSSEAMARHLARYALGSMKINEFAVLAPDDSHGPKVTEAFEKEVQNLGGKVLKSFYYAPGQTDFKGPLGEIREMLVAKTKTMWEKGELDSSIFFDDKGDTLPPEEWPVYLDGFLVVGYPEDLNLIAPQVAFSIIKTQLLGLEGWSDLESLKPSRDYIQGAVFCCHFIQDQEDARWALFSKNYRKKYGEDPDWVAALSYDCARVILQAFESGAVVPERIKDYLQKASADGVTGKIRFDKATGENQGVGIYRIRGTSWERLE